MTEIIFLVEEALEGGYNARAIDDAIFTQADTVEQLRKMVKEAVLCHFEEDNAPKIIRLHFGKEEVISLAS